MPKKLKKLRVVCTSLQSARQDTSIGGAFTSRRALLTKRGLGEGGGLKIKRRFFNWAFIPWCSWCCVIQLHNPNNHNDVNNPDMEILRLASQLAL